MSIRLSSMRTSDSQMLWMICFSTHLGTFKLSIILLGLASPLPVTFAETMLMASAHVHHLQKTMVSKAIPSGDEIKNTLSGPFQSRGI
jgi:hypothetical protein